MEKGALVKIIWEDAHSVDEWSQIDDEKLNGITEVVTVGQLIREGHSFYVVTLNWARTNVIDEEVSCSILIPKSCVRHIERLDNEK